MSTIPLFNSMGFSSKAQLNKYTETDIHGNTKTPEIAAFVIASAWFQPCINHFWSHKLRRSNLKSIVSNQIDFR